MKLIIVSILLVLSTGAFAAQKVETKIKSSDSNNSTTLSYQYGAPEGDIWSSEVSVTGTRSKVKDSSGQTEITRDVQWINTWDLSYNWFIDLGVGSSNTKVNKIRTTNADLTVGRLNEKFYMFNWSVTAGSNRIKQYEGAFTPSTKLSLTQKKLGVQLAIDPVEWMTISIFSNNYDYDKDVDQALAILQSSAAIQRYGTAFSDQLSSLVEKESGLSLSFKLEDSWKLYVSGSQTQDAPQPKVKGKTGILKLYHRFNSEWDGSVTLGSTQYDSSSQNPTTKYQYLGLGAGFSF